MIEKLSSKATYLLVICLTIPTFYLGTLVRERFGLMGNFALASLVILIGVPWAFWASRNELRGSTGSAKID